MLWDYIVVGGGLSGTVISHRIFQQDQTRKILVVDAGGNPMGDPSIVWSNSTNLIGGTYDWNISTVPQVHLNNRSIPIGQGKGLGGGTIINACQCLFHHNGSESRLVNFNIFSPPRHIISI